MAEQVMLDLETLGNGPTSVIIQIGAVKFNDTDLVGDPFSVYVDPESCVKAGLKMDASTVMWWMEQDDAARAQFKADKIRLRDALASFTYWFGDDKPVWGNGATFDNVLLDSAYRAVGYKRPWGFRSDRCFRTYKSLREDIPYVREGVAHNAVDDCKSQIKHYWKVRAAMKDLKWRA